MILVCSKCDVEIEVLENVFAIHANCPGYRGEFIPREDKATQPSAQRTSKRRRPKKDYFNPRDVAILGGDPSL
jgi:hypothetical protein